MKKLLVNIIIIIESLFIVYGLQAEDANTLFNENRKIPINKATILLKSRPIVLEKKAFQQNRNYNSRRYYLKLKGTLTSTIKKQLLKFDIVLADYVSENTYIVELDQKKIDLLKKMPFVTGFSEIDIADKVSKELYEKYVLHDSVKSTLIDLSVTIYSDVSYLDAYNKIYSIGGLIQSDKCSISNKLQISINQDNLENLLGLDIVKYVCEPISSVSADSVDSGTLSIVFWDNDSGLFDNPYSLTGNNINIAVRDDGTIDNHDGLYNRLTIIDNDTISSHATHIAGIIGSSNDLSSSPKKGSISPEVNIYSYNTINDTGFLSDFASAISYNAYIINNSWSTNIGWEGGTFYDNQSLFGDYTTDTEDMDDFIYSYYDDSAVIIKSAGNHRNDYGTGNPHDGTYYDNDGDYYNCIDPVGCAKNAITVGSVGTSSSQYQSSTFSSWGPTDDGRLKPDLVADGYNLYSTLPDNEYGYLSGSSMATAVVTGTTALIFQAFKDNFNFYPTADTVKALLCNYTVDLGKTGPDFSYGFGLLDAEATIQAILNYDNSSGGHFSKGIISETGEFFEYQFDITQNVNDDQPVSITIAWTDPPGSPSATNALVNDLDLIVYNSSGTAFFPFYFKEYSDIPTHSTDEYTVDPTEQAKTGINRYDNIEQVVIFADSENKLESGQYTIRISGYNISVANQVFACVSTVGFKGFQFNILKIKNEENEWVSINNTVIDETPDILLQVSALDNYFETSTLKYKYSTDEGTTWNNDWLSVTGIYTDENCTTACGSTHNGIAYIKQASIPFNQVSITANKIKFKVDYNNETLQSPVYTIKNSNIYHVSTSVGNDSTGKGTKTNPWATISHAITTVTANAALPAYIYVQEGNYNENITLRDYVYIYGGFDGNWQKNIEQNTTIIQGTGNNHVVTGDDNSTIDGFTIQNGSEVEGAGIYLYQTSPKISNCIIQNNTVQDNDSAPSGGGIYAYQSSAVIQNCTIKNNSASVNNSSYSSSGGGAYFSNCSIFLLNTTFETNECNNNEFTGLARGGAIYMISDTSKIINCTFKSNKTYAENEALGGAIYCLNSSSKFLGCMIYSNENENGFIYSEAIYCGNSSDTVFTNCTVYGNADIGLTISGNSPTITNCIFWGHDDEDISGNINPNRLTYSCLQDNDGGTGTIHTNPCFKDPASENFHINIDSPCIDSGNDGAPFLSLLTSDIDTETRIFDFDNEASEHIDMGADEYRWIITLTEQDNDSSITLEWDSISGETYYIEYVDNYFTQETTWSRVTQSITGQTTSTTWTDDGSETSPEPDNDGVLYRFYRVVF